MKLSFLLENKPSFYIAIEANVAPRINEKITFSDYYKSSETDNKVFRVTDISHHYDLIFNEQTVSIILEDITEE